MNKLIFFSVFISIILIACMKNEKSRDCTCELEKFTDYEKIEQESSIDEKDEFNVEASVSEDFIKYVEGKITANYSNNVELSSTSSILREIKMTILSILTLHTDIK
ncbi:MAG: hypothetical protein R2795_05215 [Saprospiraceae bacterium]